MNRKLIISILVVILVGAGLWWWIVRTPETEGLPRPVSPPAANGYIDPATLKPGDALGVFTVKSVTPEEGDGYEYYRIELAGEKVVRGRFTTVGDFGSALALEDTEVSLFLHEAGDEPLIPRVGEYEVYGIYLRGENGRDFEAKIPGGYRILAPGEAPRILEARIADPTVLSSSSIAYVTFVELISASSTTTPDASN